MSQAFSFDSMTVGTCYYPQHWSEDLWLSDLQRMQNVGISVIRVAEFSWSIFERTEGIFTFDFYDRFLSLCQQTGMKVIFGTPTATPPAWLTEKYPEVLNCNRDGVLYRHGSRRHYNYNAPIYREKSAIIVDALARHYSQHPSIIGWQIDNEFNCETSNFYSEADSHAFRVFLRRKYQSLDALNDAWGTAFWSQTYTDWNQVYVPRPIVSEGYNPHLQLDYLRFISQSCISFCSLQSQILRQYISKHVFITTNGMFGHLDNHQLTKKCLDLYTYDSYPNFAYGVDKEGVQDEMRDRWWSKNLTEVRSICPHFGIMEQQSGAGAWHCWGGSPMPHPGQITLWAMQSVAHGADFVSFFRWRTATFGTEIYWHGILNYDNRDNRRLAQVAHFSSLMQKLVPITGATNIVSFGILKDMDNVFDSSVDNWHKTIATQSENALFEASQLSHIPYNYIYLQAETTVDDLSAYRVLFMPHHAILTEAKVQLLKDYVSQGGTLVIGCRTGYKQENGKCLMLSPPGLLQQLTKSDVVDSTFVTPNQPAPKIRWNDGSLVDAPIFHDVMQALPGAKVIANYEGGYYHGQAAAIENCYGDGRVLHWGSTFSIENTQFLFSQLGLSSPFMQWLDAPQTIELVLRESNGQQYIFALNYQREAQCVTIKQPVWSMLDDQEAAGEISLPPYGVAVWRVGKH